MTRIVGFHGRMYSGKDTAASMLLGLLSDHGIYSCRAGFADKLKTSAALALGASTDLETDEYRDICDQIKQEGVEIWVMEKVDDESGDIFTPVHQITGRQYLQFYGTESHRNVFGSDFWVDALLPAPQVGMPFMIDGIDVLAVTDVRFPNEAERILDLGGDVVRITRPDNEGGDTHASEVDLPDDLVTYELSNGGSLGDLESAIDAMARQMELIS